MRSLLHDGIVLDDFSTRRKLELNKPVRPSPNAGIAKERARGEFLAAHESAYVSLPGVALWLGINRNDMKQIPVARGVVDKRIVYVKRAIVDWKQKDAMLSISLLRTLQAKQARADERKTPRRNRTTFADIQEAALAREKHEAWIEKDWATTLQACARFSS